MTSAVRDFCCKSCDICYGGEGSISHDLSANGSVLLQRFLLWERRNVTVMPFNESVQQVFARISALRDSLDGPQVHPYSS